MSDRPHAHTFNYRLAHLELLLSAYWNNRLEIETIAAFGHDDE